MSQEHPKETSTEEPAEDTSGPRRMAGREPYQEHAVIDGKRHKVYVCYNCNAETISNPLCTCGAFVRPLYGEESVMAKGIWCPVCGPIERATDHGGCPKCGCTTITDRVLCEIRAQVTLSGQLDT